MSGLLIGLLLLAPASTPGQLTQSEVANKQMNRALAVAKALRMPPPRGPVFRSVSLGLWHLSWEYGNDRKSVGCTFDESGRIVRIASSGSDMSADPTKPIIRSVVEAENAVRSYLKAAGFRFHEPVKAAFKRGSLGVGRTIRVCAPGEAFGYPANGALGGYSIDLDRYQAGVIALSWEPERRAAKPAVRISKQRALAIAGKLLSYTRIPGVKYSVEADLRYFNPGTFQSPDEPDRGNLGPVPLCWYVSLRDVELKPGTPASGGAIFLDAKTGKAVTKSLTPR